MNLETVNQGHIWQFQNNRQVLAQLKPWLPQDGHPHPSREYLRPFPDSVNTIWSCYNFLCTISSLKSDLQGMPKKIRIWRKIKSYWHTKYYPNNGASAQGFIAILNHSWWSAGWFLLTWHKLRAIWSQQRNNFIRSPKGKSGEHFCD